MTQRAAWRAWLLAAGLVVPLFIVYVLAPDCSMLSLQCAGSYNRLGVVLIGGPVVVLAILAAKIISLGAWWRMRRGR